MGGPFFPPREGGLLLKTFGGACGPRLSSLKPYLFSDKNVRLSLPNQNCKIYICYFRVVGKGKVYPNQDIMVKIYVNHF